MKVNQSPEIVQQRLTTVVEVYRVLLQADERRLHEAMRVYERSCWEERHNIA